MCLPWADTVGGRVGGYDGRTRGRIRWADTMGGRGGRTRWADAVGGRGGRTRRSAPTV
ncbi:MAG TPA: hypothetical protein PKV01_13540 [Anaerolineales bacterium]|nr:hypothetical protein [Anaerolineales bacterium]